MMGQTQQLRALAGGKMEIEIVLIGSIVHFSHCLAHMAGVPVCRYPVAGENPTDYFTVCFSTRRRR